MTRADADRMTTFIAGLGLCAAAGAFALGDARAAWSAGAGAGIALGDFWVLKRIAARVMDGNVASRGTYSFLLFVKLTVLMLVIGGLLHFHLVAPLPFLLGVSALMGGVLLGAFFHILAGPPAAESEH